MDMTGGNLFRVALHNLYIDIMELTSDSFINITEMDLFFTTQQSYVQYNVNSVINIVHNAYLFKSQNIASLRQNTVWSQQNLIKLITI